jgi:hypothetical protein
MITLVGAIAEPTRISQLLHSSPSEAAGANQKRDAG